MVDIYCTRSSNVPSSSVFIILPSSSAFQAYHEHIVFKESSKLLALFNPTASLHCGHSFIQHSLYGVLQRNDSGRAGEYGGNSG